MTEHRRLETLSEYAAATEEIIRLARRHLMLFDYDLENLGFNSLSRYDLFRDFLLQNRENRISIVLKSVDYLEGYCPRMIMLARRFSHNMAIHLALPEVGVSDPFCLADGMHYARRFHFEDPRGMLGLEDPHEGRALLQRFEEIWKASVSAVSANITGL